MLLSRAVLTMGALALAIPTAGASSGGPETARPSAALPAPVTSRALEYRQRTGSPFVWVNSAGGKQWTNQVVGGRESGRKLVICRASYRGGKHPGKVVKGNCNFGYGGKEILGKKYDVMIANGAPARWSSPTSSVPSDAYVTAPYDGRPGNICRASYKGGVHPGKVVKGNCNIGYGGKEIVTRKYQVLLNPKKLTVQTKPIAVVPPKASGAAALRWVNPRRAKPEQLVYGGAERSRKLVVCRNRYRGGQHPGKVVAGKCNFGYGGKEIQGTDYEVLVASSPKSIRWSRAQRGAAKGAFLAARYDGNAGYVCRAKVSGGVHPGKIVKGNCNVGYGGKEVLASTFETLLNPGPVVVSKGPSCAETLQGRVAWDKGGNKRWAPANIRKLCANGRDNQPARCFARLMSGKIDWGGGYDWKWENALELCAASQDGDGTVNCFQSKLKRVGGWKKAIKVCKAR